MLIRRSSDGSELLFIKEIRIQKLVFDGFTDEVRCCDRDYDSGDTDNWQPVSIGSS